MGEGRRRQSTVEWLAAFAIGAVVLALVTGEPLLAVGFAAWAAVLLFARLYVLDLVLRGSLPTWAAVLLHMAVGVVGVGGLWWFVTVS